MFFIHLKCGRKSIMENNSCNMRKGLLCGIPVYPLGCFSREDVPYRGMDIGEDRVELNPWL